MGVLADVEEGADSGRVEPRPAQLRRQRDADHQRREVADRVAPALVLLLGEDHMVGQGRAGRPRPDGDERGRRAGLMRGPDRLVRRVCSALVRHRDQQPGGDRPSERLEGLDRSDLATGRQVQGIGQEPRIAIAACSEVPHPVVTTGRPLSIAARVFSASRSRRWILRQPSREALRDGRLRGDHLAHYVRRTRSKWRHRRRRPRVRGAGQRLGWRAWHRRQKVGLRTMSAMMMAIAATS